MNNSNTKITNPIQLKRELAGVNNLDIVTGILRRAEWNLVMEMKETLTTASFYTEIGDRNYNLISVCLTLLDWVKSLNGGDNQSIIDKGLQSMTIDELLAPHDMLYKMACAND